MDDQPLQTDSKSDAAIEVARQKTKRYAKSLWEIIIRHSRVREFSKKAGIRKPDPERFEFRHKGVLRFLSLIPYVLGIMFVFSFVWDFDDMQWTIFGYSLQLQGLLKILSVSGLIGFMTNWLAITMLFKPAKKRPLLGHGLIPAQKDRIAFRLAQAVAEDLINPEIIKRKITESGIIAQYREQSTRYIKSIIDDPAFRSDLKKLVAQYVDEMIADPEVRGAMAEKIMLKIDEYLEDKSFEKVALKAYSYVKGQEIQHVIEEVLSKVPGSVERGLNTLDDMLDRLPSKLEKQSDAIENVVTNLLYKLVNQLDVHTLVEDNLKSYDEQRISDIIQNASNEQLRYIQYLGALLGMIGGFVIWEPLVSLIVLGILTLSIVLLDTLLIKFRSA